MMPAVAPTISAPAAAPQARPVTPPPITSPAAAPPTKENGSCAGACGDGIKVASTSSAADSIVRIICVSPKLLSAHVQYGTAAYFSNAKTSLIPVVIAARSARGDAIACRNVVGRRLRGAAAGRRKRVGGVEQLEERRQRQRRRKHVALRQADALVAQMCHLLEAFNALGHDVHAHAAGQLDERIDDRRRVALGADGIDEQLVDLDDVDAELQQIRETAVAGSDVVD